MYSIIVVSIVSVLLAILANSTKCKHGLEYSFVLLTLFLAFRYDFGNDYMGYLEFFKVISNSNVGLFDFGDYYSLREFGDRGWIFLCLLFRHLGFFPLIILVTVFENYVLYSFIRKNVSKEWYWLSVFIFTFQASLMLIGASMIRQWLALSLFLFCIDYIKRGKFVQFFIITLFATQIHASSWVLLPVYFLRYLPKRVNVYFVIVVIPIYVAWVFFSPQLIGGNLEYLLQSHEVNKYSVYLGSDENTATFKGFIANALFPIICLSQINRIEEEKRLLYYIFGFYLLILPLMGVAPMIGRIGTYFFVLFIAVFPETLRTLKINNSILFVPVLAVYLLWTLYNYFPFYSSLTFGEFYQEYKTIFYQAWQ